MKLLGRELRVIAPEQLDKKDAPGIAFRRVPLSSNYGSVISRINLLPMISRSPPRCTAN